MAGSARRTTVTLELGEDELLGAHLLARMEGLDDHDTAGFDAVLRSSLRHGVVDRVTAAGIAWPPPADALALADDVGRRVSGRDPDRGGPAPERRPSTRELVIATALAVAIAVVLVGGYGLHWSWTGFTANNQLWDWMQLLLLPVAIATFPLWLRFSPDMSPARRRALGAVVLVFGVFVLLGYVNPITWTGFRGQTLWNWLTLIILPLSIVTVRVWPQTGRDLHRGHVVAAVVLGAALLATIIGGYGAGWSWTGYPGNTLWDWLTLVLAPAAVTTVVVPALVRLLTGAADERAEERQDRAARELALQAARERLAEHTAP
jgi:uncharacterized membrane protein